MERTQEQSRTRLLVVDDLQDNLFVMRRVLSSQLPDCEVLTASSAGEGLSIAASRPLDGVILDIQMPGMNGLELCRRLKTQAATAGLPIILMTAHGADAQLKADGLEAGADDFISKPVDNRELVARVKVMLRIRRAEEALRTANERLEQQIRLRTAELQRSHAYARNLLDSLGERILVVDEELRVCDANRSMARAAGASVDELIGRPCHEVLRCHSDTCEPCPARQAFRSGEPCSEEVQSANGDGGCTLELLSSPLLDPTGRVSRVIVAARDITERRRLESQLRQSQKMQVVGQLAGGLAHDFNNLLMSITGFTTCVLDALEPGSQWHEDLQMVLSASGRASMLTRQLLAFSRQQELQRKPTDLNQVVLPCYRMLHRTIEENILWKLSLTPELNRVLADPAQLEQVLTNLVLNARDAMPEGGTLEIRTRLERPGAVGAAGRDGRPQAFVCLDVIDDGRGMDEATRSHALEPFFTTKEVGQGTGLGLSMVFGIVTQHGGEVQIHSAPGAGTRVEIRLPALEAGIGADGEALPGAVVGGAEVVLLVEDDPMLLQVVMRMLKSLGYQVLPAASAREAEAIFTERAGAIDLLLSDVVMPGDSGPTLARTLLRAKPELRVLLMTGYGGSNLEEALPGPFGLLAKPFNKETLAREVRRLLECAS